MYKLWLWKLGKVRQGEYPLGQMMQHSRSMFWHLGNVLGNYVDKNVCCERTGRWVARKYLVKNCCHRIECSVANFLIAFMWRRPLNNTVLAIPTHRGPERVFDGTSTQVVDWMINKWRVKIIQRGIYNVRNPWGKGDLEIERKIL